MMCKEQEQQLHLHFFLEICPFESLGMKIVSTLLLQNCQNILQNLVQV